MSVIQQDTELGCNQNCNQGRNCECGMWDDERENPFLIVFYALVIVASVLVSMLAVTL